MHFIEAKERTIRAALRCLSAEHAEENADAASEAEYAEEQLALAARDLAEATEELRPGQQPVGWSRGLCLASGGMTGRSRGGLSWHTTR